MLLWVVTQDPSDPESKDSVTQCRTLRLLRIPSRPTIPGAASLLFLLTNVNAVAITKGICTIGQAKLAVLPLKAPLPLRSVAYKYCSMPIHIPVATATVSTASITRT
jgi:hypothetical protein